MADVSIAQHKRSANAGHRESQKQSSQEQDPCPYGAPCDQQRNEAPRNGVSKNQSCITVGTRAAYRACPPQLMFEESSQGIVWKIMFNDAVREFYLKTGLARTAPKFIVVRQVICERLESADDIQCAAVERQRRSHSKAQTVPKLICA